MRALQVPVAAMALAVVLAGCAGGPVRIVPGRPSAGPPQAPSPSAEASPSATAHPDEDAAAAAVRAYAGLVARKDLAYRVDLSLAEDTGGKVVKTTSAASVAGAAFGGTIKSGSRNVQFAYVDGSGWSRAKGGKWVRVPVELTVIADMIHPWGYVCWLNDLAYMGRPAEPPDAFAFECPSGYTYQTPRMRRDGEVASIEALSLVLAADGKPVSMHVEGLYPGTPARVTSFTADLAFSKVGEAVTIKGPK